MAFVYPAYAAGASMLSALGYYTYTSLAKSQAIALTDATNCGRRDILAELVRFGPTRIRTMCHAAGIRFTVPDRPSDEDDAEIVTAENRDISEALIQEIRAALEAELRTSLRPEIETVIRGQLKEEITQDIGTMIRLKIEARDQIRERFRNDSSLKIEVQNEIKNDLQREWRNSGVEQDLIVAARLELRQAVREQLRQELRSEVRAELSRELESGVKVNARTEALRASESSGSTTTVWTMEPDPKGGMAVSTVAGTTSRR